MVDIQALAARVDDAARTTTAIAQLSQATNFSLADAYSIQKQSIARRIARGERQVGVKMGFTSRAKIIQMGLSDMIWGRLTDGMLIEDGGATPFERYVHPRVEPEVAFLLKSRLVGNVTPMQALAAVEAIAPALELIDSRYANFKNFTLEDVVADNSSSSGFATGSWHRPDLDFANLGIVMTANGRPVAISSTAAILGNPLRSLAAAARFAAAAATEPLAARLDRDGGRCNRCRDTGVEHLGRVRDPAHRASGFCVHRLSLASPQGSAREVTTSVSQGRRARDPGPDRRPDRLEHECPLGGPAATQGGQAAHARDQRRATFALHAGRADVRRIRLQGDRRARVVRHPRAGEDTRRHRHEAERGDPPCAQIEGGHRRLRKARVRPGRRKPGRLCTHHQSRLRALGADRKGLRFHRRRASVRAVAVSLPVENALARLRLTPELPVG